MIGVDRDGLAKLREPFGPEHVGLLPRVTCRDCSDRRSQCSRHQKQRCADCGAFISTAHIHLDYVGHGAVTSRLLDADPEWNWEPLAFDQAGMPAMVYDSGNHPIALWIRLTVCGVTRLGVGTCPPGQHDAEKVLIGDAIRNAAMRFGVALDLWIKGQAEDSEQLSASDPRSGPGRRSRPERTAAASDTMISAAQAKDALLEAADGDVNAAAAAWQGAKLAGRRQVTPQQMREALALLNNSTDAVREAFAEVVEERREHGQETLLGTGQ
ncbi:MAG TPA: hypothetical protein VKZ89_00220 [Thermobifida alba]|nr:hypothetical protein [Thermobifida alba]